jgi:hypothetical protein
MDFVVMLLSAKVAIGGLSLYCRRAFEGFAPPAGKDQKNELVLAVMSPVPSSPFAQKDYVYLDG